MNEEPGKIIHLELSISITLLLLQQRLLYRYTTYCFSKFAFSQSKYNMQHQDQIDTRSWSLR